MLSVCLHPCLDSTVTDRGTYIKILMYPFEFDYEISGLTPTVSGLGLSIYLQTNKLKNRTIIVSKNLKLRNFLFCQTNNTKPKDGQL